MIGSIDDDFGYIPGHNFQSSMMNRAVFDQEIKKLMLLYDTELTIEILDRFYMYVCEYLSGEEFLQAARIIYHSGIPRPKGYFPCVMDFVDLIY